MNANAKRKLDFDRKIQLLYDIEFLKDYSTIAVLLIYTLVKQNVKQRIKEPNLHRHTRMI